MARTPAGRRDQRIEFQRASSARDSSGRVTGSGWGSLGSRSAKVLFGSGAERRDAAQDGSAQAATFRVLADELTTTVLVTDRIVHRTVNWDITSVAPIGRGPGEIEFTGTASRG